MRHLLPCPPCGRQGRPGQGTWQARISEPRGSAPRERDHRGGDHPVPSRTRQLSPPSPRVLQRKAAGGQGVALAEGAFLSAPKEARRGIAPAGLSAFGGRPAGVGRLARHARSAEGLRGLLCGPSRVLGGGYRLAGCPARAALRGARRKARGVVFLAALSASWGIPIPWRPTPSRRKRPSRAAARSPGEGSFAHRPGTRRKASCAREPVKRPVPANCVRPHIVRPKARRGILPCGSLLRHKGARLGWVGLTSAYPVSSVIRGCFLGLPSARRRRALHGAQGEDLFARSFRLQALLAFRLLLCMGLRAFGSRYL